MRYQKSTDLIYIIIKKYQSPVIEKLEDLRSKRLIAKICKTKLKNIHPSRIYEILSGKQNLSPYILWLLIQEKLITIDEMLDGKRLKDIPLEDKTLLGMLCLSPVAVNLSCNLLEMGIDIEKLLDSEITAHNKGYDVIKELNSLYTKDKFSNR